MTLSNRELDRYLINLLDRLDASAYRSAHRVFLFLYETGFRISELKYITNWIINEDKSVTAQTLKKGNDRLLTKDIVPAVIYASIEDNVNYLLTQSVSNYERIFNNFKPSSTLHCGHKSISLHSFRHNRIKQYYEAVLDVNSVLLEFGLVSSEVALGYINSEIISYTK